MEIHLKRIFEPAAKDDGYRVLVDRMWPRGITKRDALLDDWCRDLAPSKELRQWFGHDRARWTRFYAAYRSELNECNPDTLLMLRERASHGRLTLLFAARDSEYNNAVVLRDHLEEMP